MKTILLSINPEHVENIFNGSKKYEYRKVKCRYDPDKIIIYSTSPTKEVVGEAKVKKVITGAPSAVWTETMEYSGISADFFNSYYLGHSTAVAFELTDVVEYDTPRSLSEYGVKSAPQSFVYVMCQ